MNQTRATWVCWVLVLSALTRVAFGAEFSFETADPATQGMSREKLDALKADLAAHGTDIFLVLRHDRLVYEWYAEGWDAGKAHGTASMAKAAVGGMSLAVAMQDHLVALNDPVSKFVPRWRADAEKSRITFMQLGTHSSGLADAEEGRQAHEMLTGWKGEFWRREPRDPFTVSRDEAPVTFEPGERVSYSNTGIAMLSYGVTAAIQGGAQKDVRSLLGERVYGPIGMGAKEWSVGYGKTYPVDGLPLVANWGGAAFTARAAARIGRLMLREGDWDGKRILDAAVVRATVHPPGAPKRQAWEGEASPSPGIGWWTNRDNCWPDVPRDAYLGAGAQDQLLIVIPSLDLVCVRNGRAITENGDASNHWRTLERHLLAPLAAAVTDAPAPAPAPLPPRSEVIRGVTFAPDESIKRLAPDSDNWPITWGDDDQLYTAYGDGRGFEPFVKPKLSNGIARVEGTPPDVRGVNVRSETGEREGGGAKGAKASGMVMVDGVLYMWLRNTNNATLTWSGDHGVTWTGGFTLEASFGCPAFLNYGRNYAGAADEYVYAFSQDGVSAYEPYDGVVCARAPKGRLTERAAWEFYTGSGWSKNVKERGHVLHYPGHCERVDVVYDAGIKRYLMTMGFGHGKGWGIFEAPSPTGPWTTAWSTKDWGQGETHGYRIPTKWISADGREGWLVFSGRKENDAFCLRRFRLEVVSGG